MVQKRPQGEADLKKILISILMLISASAQAATIEIGPGQSIQGAVDAASPGDTINVLGGIYFERINVIKPLNLVGIDRGGGRPVVDAGGFGSAFTLSSGNSNLEGFEIRNSRGAGSAGVKVTSSGNIVRGNILHDNNEGIELRSSSRNIISLNAVSNSALGIFILYSSYNIVSDNTASNNDYGIRIEGSEGNTLQGNILEGNSYNDAYDSGLNFWGQGGMGNYYSSYHLPEQGCWDRNYDGICDLRYRIPGGENVDEYPLATRSGQTPAYEAVGPYPLYSFRSSISSYSSYSVS